MTIQDRHYELLQRAANSMAFHAPQELAQILGETIDYARQGQIEAERIKRWRVSV